MHTAVTEWWPIARQVLGDNPEPCLIETDGAHAEEASNADEMNGTLPSRARSAIDARDRHLPAAELRAPATRPERRPWSRTAIADPVYCELRTGSIARSSFQSSWPRRTEAGRKRERAVIVMPPTFNLSSSGAVKPNAVYIVWGPSLRVVGSVPQGVHELVTGGSPSRMPVPAAGALPGAC